MLFPNMLQTTPASRLPHLSSHSVPHTPRRHTSTLPACCDISLSSRRVRVRGCGGRVRGCDGCDIILSSTKRKSPVVHCNSAGTAQR